MKKKCLYIGIIICAMVVIAIYSISLCGDDKGFRVVEIGKIDGIPISGPMKWAPSSDKIAFISNSNLVVADTLGKKIAEFSTEFTPRRFEWLSDKEIVYFERLMSKSIAQIRLIRCDISTGQSTIIEEFKTKKPLARHGPGCLDSLAAWLRWIRFLSSGRLGLKICFNRCHVKQG